MLLLILFSLIFLLILATFVKIIFSNKRKVNRYIFNIKKIKIKTEQVKKQLNSKALKGLCDEILSYDIDNNFLLYLNYKKVRHIYHDFIDLDIKYIKLKNNLHIINRYKNLKKEYNIKKKYGFKRIFNISIKKIKEIERKYPSLCDKYLSKFNNNYNYYYNNYIKIINENFKTGDNCLKNNNFNDLYSIINYNTKLYKTLLIELEEPVRFNKRIINAEDEIKMYIEEIKNIKGSLYFKINNILNKNQITITNSNEWDNIKENIDNLLKKHDSVDDIIIYSLELNEIINNMLSFLKSLEKHEELEKV